MNTILQISKEDLVSEIKNLISEIKNEKKEVKLYTPEQVQEILSVSSVTLWRWAKSEYLKPIYIGGKKRYKKSDIDKLIAEEDA
ncbi:MAG: helix-turn-helix domain-containing protein [Prevotella sp.]|nr:helix-turn-helix domain-containing protein [Prevotella sp.]